MVRDARSLSARHQESLRRRVIAALAEGMSQAQAARVFEVSRQAISTWWGRYQIDGADALKAGRRGRPPEPTLGRENAVRAMRLICGGCPDQYDLPFALWTREAVCGLLAQQFGKKVSVWTAGRYLAAWGLTPSKPLTPPKRFRLPKHVRPPRPFLRALMQNQSAALKWLAEEYFGNIRTKALHENALIHWWDEMVVQPGGTRATICSGLTTISTITNRSQLLFMVVKQRLTPLAFIAFLARLLRQVQSTRGGKVFLIVEGHSVYRSPRVEDWVKRRADKIKLWFLPNSAPQPNPEDSSVL